MFYKDTWIARLLNCWILPLLLNWNKIIKWIGELSLWEGREVGTECYFNLIPFKYFVESASDIYKQWQVYRLKVLFLNVLITFHLNMYEVYTVWTLSVRVLVKMTRHFKVTHLIYSVEKCIQYHDIAMTWLVCS